MEFTIFNLLFACNKNITLRFINPIDMKKMISLTGINISVTNIFAQTPKPLSPYTDTDKIIDFYREFWLGLVIAAITIFILIILRRREKKKNETQH